MNSLYFGFYKFKSFPNVLVKRKIFFKCEAVRLDLTMTLHIYELHALFCQTPPPPNTHRQSIKYPTTQDFSQIALVPCSATL